MKIVPRTLSILLALVFVSACERQPLTTTFFLTHPEEIQPAYDRCVAQDNKVSTTYPECTMVYRAIPIVKTNLTELINNPFQFGMSIMRAQSQLVSLQLKYESVKQMDDQNSLKDLQAAIADQQLQIDSRYALIKLLSRIR